jgi:hypothetical protein
LKRRDAAYADWLVIFGTEHKSPCAVDRRILEKKRDCSHERIACKIIGTAEISIWSFALLFLGKRNSRHGCVFSVVLEDSRTHHMTCSWSLFLEIENKEMRIMIQANTLNRSIYTRHPRPQHHVQWFASSHKRTLTYLPTILSQSLHSRAIQSMYVFASKKCIDHSQVPHLRPSLASAKERPSNAQAHIRSLVIHTLQHPSLTYPCPYCKKNFQPLRIVKHHDAPYKNA